MVIFYIAAVVNILELLISELNLFVFCKKDIIFMQLQDH